MDHTHQNAFVDYPAKLSIPEYLGKNAKECPVCQGYGGWNLQLNSYPLHNYEDTPANRHRYSHFRSMCNHCTGYGWVHVSEKCEGHQWIFTRNLGRCYNEYRCARCGKLSEVDSSD